MLQCEYCEAQHSSRKAITDHTIQFHSHHPAFVIRCEFGDCPATFKNAGSYNSHKQRIHKKTKVPAPVIGPADPDHLGIDPMETGDTVQVENVCDTDAQGEVEESSSDSGDDDLSAQTFNNDSDVEMSDEVVKSVVADCVLNLRANRNMSNSALEETIAMSANVLKSVLTNYAKECEASLKQQGVWTNECKLPSVDEHSSVFDELKTVKLQNKYFSEHLHLVRPQKEVIGPGEVVLGTAARNSNRGCTIQYPSYIYIPIIKTIERLLKSDNFKKLVSMGVNSEPGQYKCFSDGCIFKGNTFLAEFPDALRIILYYDDVDLCDAIGSRSGVHKLDFIYMTFDNIPLKYRSTLDAIYLVAIANSADIKEHGIDSVLEQTIVDLKELENGVMLDSGDLVHGLLIAFIGDNLAIHAVGGFKEGFTAFRPCRTCMASLDEVRNDEQHDDSLLRSKEAFSEHVKMLVEALTQGERQQFSTQFGINREPLLNSLQHFHVLDGLPPDGMHDVLEGSLPITVKLVIAKVLDEKRITLSELNKKIKNFDYGYSESKNKPSDIKAAHLTEDGNLRQSSSQMWLLGVILPLILGPYVDVGSGYWEVLENLLLACSIIFTRNISSKNLVLLEICLSDFVVGFKKYLRPTLLPKMHFMLHYVYHIKRFGPLTSFWCMRMEARHQYFKSLSKRMRNFKNIKASLAEQNMLWEAWALKKSKMSVTTKGEIEEVCVVSLQYRHFLPNPPDIVFRCKHVKICGVSFKSGKCCVAVDYNVTDKCPVFASVEEIIFIKKKPLFVCKKMKTIEYDVHLCSFEVERTNDYCVCAYENLISEGEVFHIHAALNKKYIVTKRCLGDLC